VLEGAMSLRPAMVATLATCIGIALLGCNEGQATKSYQVGTIGNARHGKELIRSYGCGACHMIPGVEAARGMVGPPLLFLADRTMIAGELPNTPANLTHWIQHPRDVEPKTAMPELGVTEDEAYDIAAYLYTLREQKGTSWID
jgi:cytochrome c2